MGCLGKVGGIEEATRSCLQIGSSPGIVASLGVNQRIEDPSLNLSSLYFPTKRKRERERDRETERKRQTEREGKKGRMEE